MRELGERVDCQLIQPTADGVAVPLPVDYVRLSFIATISRLSGSNYDHSLLFNQRCLVALPCHHNNCVLIKLDLRYSVELGMVLTTIPPTSAAIIFNTVQLNLPLRSPRNTFTSQLRSSKDSPE